MTLIDRIKAALKSLPFSGRGGGNSNGPYWLDWNPYPRTAINYANEVGDLGGSSLIMSAVNWTGTVLPEAPVQVVKRSSPKVSEPLPDHPMVALIERPNPYYSGDLLWKAFAYSWIVDGNVYLIKWRNPRGQVNQLWYEPHFNVRARWPADGSEFISYYEVLRDGQWLRVEVEDIIHFRYGIDPQNPRCGLSPVASVLREIFTDGERARYSGLILRNGGVIPYIVTPDPTTSSVGIDKEEFKAEWMSRTTGDNVAKPLVLDSAVRVQALGLSPEQMLVDKASQIPEERIAAVLGIPAIVLGFGAGLARSTFSNYAESRSAAYESMVIPTWRMIAAELHVQLLPDFGDANQMRVRHDLAQVRALMEDRRGLFERECMAYEKGVKTRAETRSALGLDTTPDDEVYFVLPQKEVEDGPPVDVVEDDAQEMPKQLMNGRDRAREMA